VAVGTQRNTLGNFIYHCLFASSFRQGRYVVNLVSIVMKLYAGWVGFATLSTNKLRRVFFVPLKKNQFITSGFINVLFSVLQVVLSAIFFLTRPALSLQPICSCWVGRKLRERQITLAFETSFLRW
jgi:uncharacterized membrane protein